MPAVCKRLSIYIYIYIIMSMCYPNDNVSRYPKSRSFHAS